MKSIHLRGTWLRGSACALAALLACGVAHSADDDALSLPGEAADAKSVNSPLSAMIELGGARLLRQNGGGSVTAEKFALDLRYASALNEDWRLTLSDRFEAIHPRGVLPRNSTNSLREAFVAYQPTGGSMAIDAGRVNLRQGPAFGFNPTDFFRAGAWRSQSTADPIALRGYRMGTVMGRLAVTGDNGGTVLVLAPRITQTPDLSSAGPDWQATNHSHRAAGIQTLKLGPVNVQASALLEQGRSATLGLSGSGVVTDALVAYGEATSVKASPLLDQVLGVSGERRRTQQVAAGLTYTLADRTSITAEYEYNGLGLDATQWDTLFAAGGAAAYGRLLAASQASQELTQRRAVLLYVTRPDLGLKKLDLTALVRRNVDDRSWFGWAELKYRFDALDVAVQLQRAIGSARSEFGAMPYRSTAVLLVQARF